MSKLSLGVQKAADDMRRLPALPDPSAATVANLHDGCRRLESWMEEATDVPQLEEAWHWISAVEEYLSKKNAEGPAQTTARLLEARIGAVVGPPRDKAGRPPRGEEMSGRGHIPRQRIGEFYDMAEHRKVWIDKLPLPRDRILRLIREELADLRPQPETPTELLCDIRTGDFREVLADVPDESIDLILSDPPYPAEFLPLWSDLAIFARRVLAPHGLLVAMSGQTHLPEVYRRLSEYLPYRWTVAYLTPGASYQAHHRNVTSQWKPVLVYGSTSRRLHDVATSKAADKEFHGWGQSESGMFDLLQLAADPGMTVCDPFVGGGTTAVVAAALGCHFIGAELDPEVHDRAMKRLAA